MSFRLKKIHDIFFIVALLLGMLANSLLRKTAYFSPFYVDVFFNCLLIVLLFAFYVKKYSPDLIRKSLLLFFLIELAVGILMRKLGLSYHAEVTWVGLLGCLFCWWNTHTNRHKFKDKDV